MPQRCAGSEPLGSVIASNPSLPRPLAAALSLLALLGPPGAGRAQGEPQQPAAAELTGLDVSACAASWARELPRLTRIELGAALADRPSGSLELGVRCEAESVTMQVRDRATATTTERRMDLSGTAPSVRGRVVALAIAGLMRELTAIARAAAADRERALAPEPAPKPARPAARTEPAAEMREQEEQEEPAVPAPPSSTGSLQVGLLLLAANFAGSSDLVWGGGVRADYLRLAPWRFALDLHAGTYARDSDLGSARLLSASLGARAGFTLASSALALFLGVGQRLGIARASARAEDENAATGKDVLGAWTAPFAFATLELAAFGAYRIALDGELGIVLLPVHGRVQRGEDIDVSGAWAALSLLLALRL